MTLTIDLAILVGLVLAGAVLSHFVVTIARLLWTEADAWDRFIFGLFGTIGFLFALGRATSHVWTMPEIILGLFWAGTALALLNYGLWPLMNRIADKPLFG